MYKPDDLERHIILYTKNWYKKTNLIDDLKIIICNEVRSKPEYLLVGDILYWVEKVYFEIFNKQQIEFHFGNLFKYKETLNPESFIEFVCEKIAYVKVRDGEQLALDLGEPDYTILPKYDKK